MSEAAEQRGLGALTDDDWDRLEAMADDYDDAFGDALADLVAGHDAEASDGE